MDTNVIVLNSHGQKPWKAITGKYGHTVFCPWTFNSCAVGTLEGISNWPTLATWKEKAEWMSSLYRNLYTCGHVLYIPSGYQLHHPAHKALLEIGSREIVSFNNIYHGFSRMHVFLVNVRNACGRFCNEYGEPYKEPPTTVPEINPDPPSPSYAFQELPKRTK